MNRPSAFVFSVWLLGVFATAAGARSLPDTLDAVRPGIVGVGTYLAVRTPPTQLKGTGFAVHDGRHILTNAHVVSGPLDKARKEYLAVFTGHGKNSKVQRATLVASDEKYDLALLRIDGPKLPPMTLGRSRTVREGEEYVFTGFPIGLVLGLYPVTHRAMVSAISPVVIPQRNSSTLTPEVIRRLRNPWSVFQLDATAYPGNSGSPLYDAGTGVVVGVINKVFIKETKETLLQRPSGITYAIPIEYGRQLVDSTVK